MATVQEIKNTIFQEVSFSKKANSYFVFDAICEKYGSKSGYDEVYHFIEEIRQATEELVNEGRIEVIYEGEQAYYLLVE